MGSSTEYSAYGPTHNPWDLGRIPGGSGGGSAAALAAYEAPLAIGTDTGGSIRQPGAVTGTVGRQADLRWHVPLRPDRLLVQSGHSRAVRPYGRGHRAAARGAWRGHDPRDSTSIPAPVPPDVVAAAGRGASGDLSGVRIGLVTEFSGEGAEPGVDGGLPRRGRGAGEARRRDRRGVLPALRVRAAGLLPDRAERGVVQPGPLRRRPVRPAGRRRRRSTRSRRSCR